MSEPGLLVSVRSAQEAVAALRGGADVIDVKEPNSGPLGAPSADVLRDVTRAVERWAERQDRPVQGDAGRPDGRLRRLRDNDHDHVRDREIPLTVALGELGEQVPLLAERGALVACAVAKIGLAAWRSRPSWSLRLDRLRERLADTVAVVPAAYADARRADAPDPWDVARYAREARCPFLLVDTAVKDGRGLLDWLHAEELAEIAAYCRAAGTGLVLAGSLGPETFGVARVLADLVAVRGAACSRADRTATVEADRARELRRLLGAGWAA